MEIETVKQQIESQIEGATALVTGDGCSCAVEVISDTFTGKSLLEKQRMVMGTVNSYIVSGELHALAVKTYTQAEWNDKPQ